MSIIYATLERLEADIPTPAYNEAQTGSPRPAVESGGLSLKTVATAMMVVIAGTSLMLWYPSGESGGPENSVPAGKSEHQLSPVLIGEQSNAPLEPTGPNIETPALQDADPALPAPPEMAASAGKQRVAVEEVTPELHSIEEPLIAARVRDDTDSSPVAKPGTAAAEPGERKQIASSQTVQAVGIDEVIEQARFTLSRGRYPQALSTLEALAPIPENRADFWLIKGSAHLGIGQFDLAEVAFAAAQALAPDNAQIAVQQAILKQEKGDHAGALQILQLAAIRHPDVPEIFLNQGYSQQALGAVLDARRSFRAFLNMTENRSLYLQQRTVVKEWLGQGPSV